MRRYVLTFALLILPLQLLADNAWIELAGSRDAKRASVTRSLDTLGLEGASLGASHFRTDESRWTLANFGFNTQANDRLFLQAGMHLGPGELDGDAFVYRKLLLGATWLLSERWSLALTDTYINVHDTVGHVVSTSVTRTTANGLGITLVGSDSIGSRIDSQQVGLSFNFARHYTLLGGIYVGETSNTATLSEVGASTAGVAVKLREAYLGAGIPIGDYTLTTVLDYLRLDDFDRYEVSLVLKIPLGRGQGASR